MGLRSELKSAIQQAASQGQLNLKDKRAVVGFIRDYATDYRGLKQSAATTQGLVDQGISPTVYGSPDALRSAQDEYAISRAPTPYEGLRSMPSPGALDIRTPEPQPQVGSGYDYFAMLQGGPTGNIQPPADNPALKMTYAAGAGLRPPTDQEAVASGRAPALAALQDEARQLYEWSKSNPAKASAALATMEAGGNMSFGGSDMAQLAWAGRSPEEMRTLKAAMAQGVSEGGGIMSKDVIPGVIGVAGYAPTLLSGGGVARALAGGALPSIGQRALGLGIAGMAQDVATPIAREQVGGPVSTEDPLFRAARGFTGGASAVAGTGLARALPGARPFATMLAGDVAASAGQAAAFAPEGERGRAAISGGLFGLLASAAGAKGEKAYLDDLAAQQSADAVNQRVDGMTRGLPAPPEQKLLPERAESITPELQAQMDRAYALQQEAQRRPIPMPGPVQEPPFTRVPPPEMQAEAIPQPRTTAGEDAQLRRIEQAKAAVEQARARAEQASITPETYGIEAAPPKMEAAAEIAPQQAPAPKSLADEVRALPELGDLTRESAVAMMRKYGATRPQMEEIIREEFRRRTEVPVPRQPKVESVTTDVPKGNRGIRAESVDPRTLESQQPKEMFSGPIGMVPKAARDAVDKSMLGIWKDVKQGATLDPRKKAAMQRDLYNRFEDFKDKTSTTLGKIGFSPKALEALGLRHPMKAVRDLQKLRQDLVFDYARRGITEFEVGVAKMKPEQVEKIHELAEGYKPGWDEKSDEILRNFHQIVQENAKAIVDLGSPKTVAEAERIQKAEGLKFRPFTSEEMAQKFSEYQKPGQQGYVTHIRAVAESSVAGMMDARRLAKMRARLEKPMEPGKRADLKARIAALEKKMQGHEAAAPIKNADDLARRFSADRPGLEREATKASAIYEARTKARKQMTFAEMKAEGYVVGKDAMSATMLGEGQLAITLKVMEQAAKNSELKPFIADIPNDADPAKPPNGWSLAKGAGWGPLRGKWLRDDVFVSLEPMTDFKKNGAWEIAQAITAATRSAAVLTSPKFHAITNPITGTLTAMQTVPLHKMPKAMFGADGSAAKIARFMSKGEAHPHIKELMADGQFRKVIDLADALEEHVASHAKDFRDLEGGASYIKDFLDRAIENAKIRASNAMESRVGGNESTTQVANRFLYGAAQVIRWSTETLSGFDPLKAIGIDTSKLPEGLRAKLSVEGLGDLSALQDDFFRLTVYSHLRDMGLTAKESLGITADWFDVRRIPPIVRVATRVPVLGPTFGHWGWMYFRNMFLKRYALATPLKALALLAPVYVITEATKKMYGLSDDELDEMKKKAGIVPGSADDMGMAAIPGPDGKPAFLDIGTISALQAMTDSVPLLNMNHTDQGPDGQFARAFRAQARQNLLGTAFYKMFLGIDPRSGEHGRHATLADTLRLFPFLPGTSTARILGEMDRRETQKKYDPAKEGRDWADFVASAITGVRFPDGSTRYADKRQKEMELYEQGARGFTIPESPKKVKFRRSSRPQQMPKMNKP